MAGPNEQRLNNTDIDLADFGSIITGDATTDVVTRSGQSVPTMAKVAQTMIDLAEPIIFSTEAALLVELNHPPGQKAYAEDTDTEFIKTGASGAGAWKSLAGISSTLVSRVDDVEAVSLTLINPDMSDHRQFQSGTNGATGDLADLNNWELVTEGKVKQARTVPGHLATAGGAFLLLNTLIEDVQPNQTYTLIFDAYLIDVPVPGTVNQIASVVFPLDDSFVYSSGQSLVGHLLTGQRQTIVRPYQTGATPDPNIRLGVRRQTNVQYADAGAQIVIENARVIGPAQSGGVADRVAAVEARIENRAAPPNYDGLRMAHWSGMNGTRGRLTWQVDSDKWFNLQTVERHTHIEAAGALNPKLDLTWMTTDTRVVFMISGGGGRSVTLWNPSSFFGRADNQVVVTGPAIVEIDKFGTEVAVHVRLFGAATETYSSVAVIVKEESIAFFGQSNQVLMLIRGFVSAFEFGRRDVNFLGHADKRIDKSFNFISGGTGATALLRASVAAGATNYWWDAAANGGAGAVGPALQTFKDLVQASVDAGQPVPEIVGGWLSESDVKPMQQGNITVEELRAGIEAMLTHMRAFLQGLGASSPEFLYVNIASQGPTTSRVGQCGVYEAWAKAEANLSWLHGGVHSFDVKDEQGDIHLPQDGYFQVGRRWLHLYMNIARSESYDLGPKLGTWVKSSNGRRLTALVTSTGSVVMPRGLTSPGVTVPVVDPVEIGGAAFGFGVIAPDGSLVPIEAARVSGNSIVLEFGEGVDVTGHRVCFPFGELPEWPLGDYVRDSSNDNLVRRGGKPLLLNVQTIA